MAAHGYFGDTHTNPNKSLSGLLWTKPLTALESGFKMMRFRCPDSLVSCGPKVRSCKKVCGFENIQIRVEGAFIAKVFTETIMHLFYTPFPPKKKCITIVCGLSWDDYNGCGHIRSTKYSQDGDNYS